ncbi:MAG TPA: 2-oxoglutarate oxidoreductase, partial [Clostridiales bacterium]|nr:2-oxoglutarate oxidoreductase [Clostridiales bacterium]
MKYSVPKGINREAHIGWCPGCGHGIIVRLVAEAAAELGINDRIIMVEDVACGEFAQTVTQYNNIGGAHGRPIITAAGAKRARPDAIVIAHPGDGSAYSIGIESRRHCALRNENILALVVNNGVFGMTGGQMSPASLPGQKTTSSPKGRDINKNGSPFDVVKALGQFDIAYLARGTVSSPA